jgi:hypothetical protein
VKKPGPVPVTWQGRGRGGYYSCGRRNIWTHFSEFLFPSRELIGLYLPVGSLPCVFWRAKTCLFWSLIRHPASSCPCVQLLPSTSGEQLLQDSCLVATLSSLLTLKLCNRYNDDSCAQVTEPQPQPSLCINKTMPKIHETKNPTASCRGTIVNVKLCSPSQNSKELEKHACLGFTSLYP